MSGEGCRGDARKKLHGDVRDLWATARDLDETGSDKGSTEAVAMARLALDTRRALIGEQISEPTALAAAREDAEYRRAVADVLKAKHEGGSGAFWAEWHRDHCAAAQAADEARAEVADLRDRLAKVQAVLADSCHHCGRLPDEDGDHTCTCPVTDSECLEHTAEPVVSLSAVLAALGDADTLAERCLVSDAALGRCVLDAHDGDIHAWEGVAGPPGPPQRWQSSERADRIEGATDE